MHLLKKKKKNNNNNKDPRERKQYSFTLAEVEPSSGVDSVEELFP
jgi:hypothetical protein